MLETSAWLLLSLLQVVHAPAAFVRGRLPIPVEVQSLDEDDRCAFEPGSDHRPLCSDAGWTPVHNTRRSLHVTCPIDSFILR